MYEILQTCSVWDLCVRMNNFSFSCKLLALDYLNLNLTIKSDLSSFLS